MATALQQTTEREVPFQTPDDMTDVIFLVEGRKLYFNKTILAMSSPVFKRMLLSDFKEKDAKLIPLPEKRFADVAVFFEQIHPAHSAQPITDNTLQQLLSLADEYQVENVRKKCEQYIGSQMDKKGSLSDEQVLLYFWMCEDHKLEMYAQSLSKVAAVRRVKNVMTTPVFNAMSPDALIKLLIIHSEAIEDFMDKKKMYNKFEHSQTDHLTPWDDPWKL